MYCCYNRAVASTNECIREAMCIHVVHRGYVMGSGGVCGACPDVVCEK